MFEAIWSVVICHSNPSWTPRNSILKSPACCIPPAPSRLCLSRLHAWEFWELWSATGCVHTMALWAPHLPAGLQAWGQLSPQAVTPCSVCPLYRGRRRPAVLRWPWALQGCREFVPFPEAKGNKGFPRALSCGSIMEGALPLPVALTLLRGELGTQEGTLEGRWWGQRRRGVARGLNTEHHPQRLRAAPPPRLPQAL